MFSSPILKGFTMPTPLAYSTPLNQVSGASLAYSLRKLNSAYTGFAIKVRRSSDNTLLDIPFYGNGKLAVDTLLNFVGSGDGFISTWYDQSGNGRDAIQSTTSLQPQIVSSGAIISSNGNPAIKFTKGTNGQYLSTTNFVAYASGFTHLLTFDPDQLPWNFLFGKLNITYPPGCCASTMVSYPAPFLTNFYSLQPGSYSATIYNATYAGPQSYSYKVDTLTKIPPIGGGNYLPMQKMSNGNYVFLEDSTKTLKFFNSSYVYQSNVYLGFGTTNGKLGSTMSYSLDSSDNIYIFDRNRIQKFNSSGVYQSSVAMTLCMSGWVDKVNNFVYAYEYNTRKVNKYDSSLNLITSFGGLGTGSGLTNTIYWMTSDSSGNVYLCDSTNTLVQIFNSSGVYQRQIAMQSGTMAVDSSGNIFVTGSTVGIKKYNSTGTLQATYATAYNYLSLHFDGTNIVAGYINPSNINLYTFNVFSTTGTQLSSIGANSGAIGANVVSFSTSGVAGTSVSHYLNGNANGNDLIGTGNYQDGTCPLYIGGSNNSDWYSGKISEIISYPSQLTSTNRQTLESNMKTYYGTP